VLVRAEEFDNATWVKTRASVTPNVAVAPSGAMTADKLVEDTSNNSHFLRQDISGLTIGAPYTITVYAKAAGRDFFAWVTSDGAFRTTFFNLSNGTLGTVASGHSATITNVGDGWYRCGITLLAAQSTSISVFPSIAEVNGNTSYQGDGTSGAFIWGAQLEAGAFATSYIPTVASQVTRAADSASMIGNNFARWYRRDEGSVYYEGDRIVGTGASSRQLTFSDGSSANSMLLYSSGADALQYCTSLVATATVWDLARSSVSSGVPFKKAFGYAANDVGFVLNAGAVAVDTANTIPVVDRMLFGQTPTGGGAQQSQHIKRIAYYPRRLANTELQGITS
jgi:hypothetical protein